MGDPRLHTRFCDLVGVRYPIVQTGMGWVAGPRLAIATANAGGLGILAAATLTFDEMVADIDEVRAGTDAPFGVNMRTDADDVERRVEHLITAEVKVASFAQAPGQATVARLKEAGVVVIPTIGACRHAEKVAEWGVDAVIAQGTEGGGHTGVVPTSLLIPQVLDAVDLPVIAAGGFVDGRGLAAALAWGADGIAMGTRFLLTTESTVPDVVKARYLATPVTGTVVTTAIDGAPQRVIATDMIRRLEAARLTRFPRAATNALRFRRLTGTPLRALLAEGLRMKRAQDLTWGQVALAANAPMLTRATMVEGRTEVGILPTGQGVGSIDELPSAAELVGRIMAEAGEALDRLCGA
ncbi:MAG TPA: nitronate monooxygenase [Acidimicrobiales bacterium]|jgi:NAD(P)H-dependent flavin oxidoreductase YrpB (nitropropane dioxygenase family)|nr:nitronate monooxygenase [Actinomycetes bacterium]MDP6105319.1 nitronate monooxygenase [Acidimicrobiales bacterium]MCP4844080.1 nitronate monooxygenase [Actinomycetes bacterium]MDP6239557.1 nitronate monooxygenase [Acidimicrobiales bacterium]MDP7124194.1 nitronate monooxygenase [Acidimicrobiales bacterium]|tara:strand:- start:13666 stop:14724 length:1059 start_codon:yes stop_codon:yes gene_type:complete